MIKYIVVMALALAGYVYAAQYMGRMVGETISAPLATVNNHIRR